MYQAAATELQRAIKLKPDFPRLYLKLGEAYAKLGNGQAALEQYQHLEKIDAEAAKELLALIHESRNSVRKDDD
jgi:tetratricopeptide (TPR) repeat protein